jgi:hypothetical protein
MGIHGFSIEENDYAVRATKGKYTFSFSKESITIRVNVTNRFGIQF